MMNEIMHEMIDNLSANSEHYGLYRIRYKWAKYNMFTFLADCNTKYLSQAHIVKIVDEHDIDYVYYKYTDNDDTYMMYKYTLTKEEQSICIYLIVLNNAKRIALAYK